jgi:hypothetical protein
MVFKFAEDMIFLPFMAVPNRMSRNLLSGRSSQLQNSSLKLSALFTAALFGSLAFPSTGSRRVSVK